MAFFAEVLAVSNAERATAFLSPAFRDHDPASGFPADAAGVVLKLRALWAAFPDGVFELLETIVASDRAAA